MSERDAIVAMLHDIPEPIVNEMMVVRARDVDGLHLADQIRRMLLVVADAVERGEHLYRDDGTAAYLVGWLLRRAAGLHGAGQDSRARAYSEIAEEIARGDPFAGRPIQPAENGVAMQNSIVEWLRAEEERLKAFPISLAFGMARQGIERGEHLQRGAGN